jgi:DNA (cytosine-5)-methyltransferase 1
VSEPRAYYNENDPACCAILDQLIADGVIAPGVVDRRSIKDVKPDDLAGFTQCHFFAGGGLWSVAARLAGWPDDRPIWTASCPCQPFSVACRPAVIVGEQVAGAAGYGWLDGVISDLASEGYAGRGVDIPACAVDAPHIRQRLYWCGVADAPCLGEREQEPNAPAISWKNSWPDIGGPGWEHGAPDTALADAQRTTIERNAAEWPFGVPVGDADDCREPQRQGHEPNIARRSCNANARRNGTHWTGAEWIVCHDGKARRAEPSIRLLVDGFPGRVDLWRTAGNAIVPVLAAEVIAALRETIDERRAE